MKKLFTILLASCSFYLFSQSSPTVEATYLPVANTSVKQVWNTNGANLGVPTASVTNFTWDYSNGFSTVQRGDTFQIKTMYRAQSTYSASSPNITTHATFLRTPKNVFGGALDSLYSFILIDQSGLYNVGGYQTSKQIDSVMSYTKKELLSLPSITYGDTQKDTSSYIAYSKKLGPFSNAKIINVKYKDLAVVGYGTLAVPNATYSNVLLARSHVTGYDSVFLKNSISGGYNFFTKTSNDYYEYFFLRNNTFGTSYLMYFNVDANNASVTNSYYNIPVDTGNISGTVFTNNSATTTVTQGKAYLYRENSNFAKNDILATVPLDASGKYQFNAIPYGVYRVAIRPDTNIYHHAFITYYGDSTDWLLADVITTFGTPESTNNDIHLRYEDAQGQGSISGNILSNPSVMRTMQAPPVKAVGIVVKKKPSNGASRVTVSDGNGNFDIDNLDIGTYELFVDIPGLQMADTYTFSISGTNSVTCLDYAVGTNSIHPTCAVVTNVTKTTNTVNTSLNAFPNPYSSNTTISINIPETSTIALEVYNLLGEKVQTLDKSQKQKRDVYP